MKTQTFKIRKRFIPNFLVLSASAVLVLFGTLLIASPVSTNTNAEDAPAADGISLVTSKTIEASIHPEENGSLSIIKDTIIGSTNSQYGYEIYISVNSDEVNDIYLNGNSNNDGANQKINATTGTYDTPAALDLTNGATWGYAVAGLGNFDASYNIYTPAASSKFAAMPMIDDKQLIREVSTSIADDETDIYYGINTDSNLEPGVYKTEIIYTAIPKPAPRYARAILGDNGNLNFVYDSNTYTVGDTYTDNTGETEVAAVYDVPVTGEWDYRNHPEWTKSNATSANFDSSFHDFEPISTSQWFYGMSRLGPITNTTNLNLSEVINMSSMFQWVDRLIINDIGEWDVSNVKDMSGIFECATINKDPNSTAVNMDLGGWDVGNVENMSSMFEGFADGATSINLGDIGSWETGNVKDMSNMFKSIGDDDEASIFDIDLSGWDVSHVINMSGMFSSIITGDYSGGFYFDVGDLGGWDVGNVTDMSYMFDEAAPYATTWHIGDLSNWDVKNVENMRNMFSWIGGDDKLDIGDLSGWEVGNVTDMSYMFEGFGSDESNFNLGDLGGWDVSKVTDMTEMFRSTSGSTDTIWYIGDIGYVDEDHPGWDVGNVKSMSMMFAEAGWYVSDFYLGNLSHWNVSNVTNMSYMFRNAGGRSSNFDLGDLSSWNVGNVTTMSYMFDGAGQTADYWYIGDISGWNVSKVGINHANFIKLNEYGTNASVVNNQPNW